VIIILGFFVMRRFVITPIEELEKGFRKVADGKLNFHLAQRGIREMQVINSSFNETIDSLQTTYKDLEDRVVQRTSELEKERGSLESKIKERTKELEDLKLQLENLVAQRTQELSKKATELETMNQLMVGRELKMTELKQEIQALKEKLERPKS
jgi:nitrate/nitrite-specific signal transduction histidine kinase